MTWNRVRHLPAVLLAAAFLLPAPPAPADVLVLQDGSHVSGEVTDAGAAYAVKTKYGTLNIPKSQVKTVIASPAAVLAEVGPIRGVARTMVKEAQAADDPTARNAKLDAAVTLLEQVRRRCTEARAAYPGPEGADLEATADAIAEEIAAARKLAAPAPAAGAVIPPVPPPTPPVEPIPGTIEPPPPPAGPVEPPAPPEPVRLPVPDAAAQGDAEKNIREIFRAEYRLQTDEAMAQLAGRLLQEGAASENEPASRYVLFREARDMAVKARETEIAMQAVEAMAAGFEIDAVEEKLAVLAQAERLARTVDAGRVVAEQYLRLLEEATKADRLDDALRIGTRAKTVARATRDATLVAGIQERVGELEDLRREAAAVARHLKTLETSPEDATANAAAGKFYCLAKEDWKRGLPMLARGSDRTLRALAEQELAGPTEPAAMIALADAWWKAGDRLRGKEKYRHLLRAIHWYGRAAPTASGLTRSKINARMASFDKQFPRRLSLAGRQPLQGFGTTTRGGAGHAVVRVKTLAARGPDSLSEALEAGNRTIVFDVAGEIVGENLDVKGPFVTIDGLSAPSPGITIRNGGLRIREEDGKPIHDVIVRGLRFRGGNIQIGRGAHNIVVDHVSFSGGRYAGLYMYRGAHDVTVSWCLFGKTEAKEAATLGDTSRMTLHHNLFATGARRGPDISTPAAAKGRPASREAQIDFRNNLVWGWGPEDHWLRLRPGTRVNAVGKLFGANGGNKDAAIMVTNSSVQLFAAGNASADAGGRDPDSASTERSAWPAPFVNTTDAFGAARDVLSGAGMRPLDDVDREAIRGITLPIR